MGRARPATWHAVPGPRRPCCAFPDCPWRSRLHSRTRHAHPLAAWPVQWRAAPASGPERAGDAWERRCHGPKQGHISAPPAAAVGVGLSRQCGANVQGPCIDSFGGVELPAFPNCWFDWAGFGWTFRGSRLGLNETTWVEWAFGPGIARQGQATGRRQKRGAGRVSGNRCLQAPDSAARSAGKREISAGFQPRVVRCQQAAHGPDGTKTGRKCEPGKGVFSVKLEQEKS